MEFTLSRVADWAMCCAMAQQRTLFDYHYQYEGVSGKRRKISTRYELSLVTNTELYQIGNLNLSCISLTWITQNWHTSLWQLLSHNLYSYVSSEISESSMDQECLMEDNLGSETLLNDSDTAGSTSNVMPVNPSVCNGKWCDVVQPVQIRDKDAIQSTYRRRSGGSSLLIGTNLFLG